MRPTTLQLEVTYACNNRCGFCYNTWSHSGNRECVSLERLKTIIVDIKEYGIFSININGGEPLWYPHFFELVDFIKYANLDVHLNTNATLIDVDCAKHLAKHFEAVCTSLHGSSSGQHDKIVGRQGAFMQTLKGIQNLHENGIYVAVNITLSKLNINSIENILKLLVDINVKTVLLSRVLTSDEKFAISDRDFILAIGKLSDFCEHSKAFSRIALPQPFPICRCDDLKLRDFISAHNIPCTAGLLTARITPSGFVTPCTVLEKPVMGNIKDELFSCIWDRFINVSWHKQMHCIKCESCGFFQRCAGGCLPQKETGVLMP